MRTRAVSTLARAPSLPDTVAQVLRKEIATGRLAPGQQLPVEQELVDRFGVSRPVVREAIARLRNDGVVQTFQGRGVFVAEQVLGTSFRIDADATARTGELRQVFELRMMIEAGVAALAAGRRTLPQLRAIAAALERIRSASPGADLVDKDMRFHAAIAQACGNRYVKDFALFMDAHVRRSIRAAVMADDRLVTPEGIYAEHRPIYEAIRAQDAAAAHAAAVEHLTNAARELSIDMPAPRRGARQDRRRAA